MVRVYVLVLCLSFLSWHVSAEELAAASAPVAPETMELPVLEIPAVQPVVTEADKLQIERKRLAPLRLEALRATVKATTAERGFFKSLFTSAVRPVDTELVAELGTFIEQFPELEESAEARHLKAQVNLRIDNFSAAALDWMLLVVAWPESKFVPEAHKGLKELGEGKLKKHAETLTAAKVKLATLTGERDQRVAGALAYLGTLREPELAAAIAAECAAFLRYNRDYAEEDRIVHAQGRQQMLLGNEPAIYHFDKLLALYPASTMRADSHLSLGTINRKGLKNFEKAAASFKTVIEKHADSEEAKLAYEALGNMYDEDMNDHANAIKTYDAIVARYGNDPVVMRGLQAQARIYQDKTGQPAQAIVAWRKLAELFKGPEGLDALLKAERLAYFIVRDWKLAIEINDLIIAGYPTDGEAANALYANAGIHEDKLKDKEQGIKLYRLYLEKHPNHALAGDAKRRIDMLEKK